MVITPESDFFHTKRDIFVTFTMRKTKKYFFSQNLALFYMGIIFF